MNYFESLMKMSEEIETKEPYSGYFYSVAGVVTIIVMGLLCEQRTAQAICQWASSENVRQVLRDSFGIMKIPCYAQFMNILGNIKADSLDKIFIEWCKIITAGRIEGKTIAIDGKTVRSTDGMDAFENPLHIVSAQIAEYGLTIGQVAVDDKSNEIPAVQSLIRMLCIEGALVVADALNCQKKTAQAIIEGHGDYLLSAKGNQPDLHSDIKLFFETESGGLEKFVKSEKGHGRVETRTAWVTHETGWYENGDKWPDLMCFGAVRRVCVEKGKKSVDTRYYISSRKLSAEELLKYSRNEWGVESMHWLLDVVYDEDRTLLIERDAQRTLNTLRKTALNLIRMYKNEYCPKSSLVRIMRDNLFSPSKIPLFFNQLGALFGIVPN